MRIPPGAAWHHASQKHASDTGARQAGCNRHASLLSDGAVRFFGRLTRSKKKNTQNQPGCALLLHCTCEHHASQSVVLRGGVRICERGFAELLRSNAD